MGKRDMSSLESQKHGLSFTASLASALFEWVLIFMLLIYGIFGYIITRFARYCELQIPCLLCSRIDHIIGRQKLGVYRDMICNNHKLEISSLVFCHFHEKLVDVRGMCENCLFSFATKDKSNAETYRLLVGKLGVEEFGGLEEDPLLVEQKLAGSSMKHCCCCNELWTSRHHTRALLQTRSIGFDGADLELPLSNGFSGERDDAKEEMKNSHFSAGMAEVEGKGEDSLVHFEYSELKITSDSDSEDTRALIFNDPLRDLVLESTTPIESLITLSDGDNAAGEPINVDVLSREPSQTLFQVSEPHVDSNVTCAPAIGHGLEELNWQEIDLKIEPSVSTETANIIQASKSSSVEDIAVNVSEDESDIQEAPVVQVQETVETHALEGSVGCTDLNSSKMRFDHNEGGLRLQIPNLDLVDAYKLAITSRGRQLSSKLSEHLTSPVISGDLKVLLSQFSRGLESPLNDIMSPRIVRNVDELKINDPSALFGMKLLQKRLSLERNDSRSSLDRNESGIESLDFSAVTEIEGEGETDRLKRQLEHDRKCLSALLKELEEERNASAIAANEAMAMITRLQEEKASFQMEASQGIRIMEEQAEYDMEALDKLNDLLTEKEKEVEDLEAELEYYRTKYPNESFLENQEVGHNENNEEELYDVSDLEKKLSYLLRDTKHRDFSNGDPVKKLGQDSYDLRLHDEDLQIKNEGDQNNVVSQEMASVSKASLNEEADVVALGYGLRNVTEKLEAIEADQSSLEHATADTLNNVEEGVVQETTDYFTSVKRGGHGRDSQ